MEKKEALSSLNKTIMNVKAIRRFKGKADLLNKLRALYFLVETHTSTYNYDSHCVAEADRLFNEAINSLVENVPVGQND